MCDWRGCGTESLKADVEKARQVTRIDSTRRTRLLGGGGGRIGTGPLGGLDGEGVSAVVVGLMSRLINERMRAMLRWVLPWSSLLLLPAAVVAEWCTSGWRMAGGLLEEEEMARRIAD